MSGKHGDENGWAIMDQSCVTEQADQPELCAGFACHACWQAHSQFEAQHRDTRLDSEESLSRVISRLSQVLMRNDEKLTEFQQWFKPRDAEPAAEFLQKLLGSNWRRVLQVGWLLSG